jgi:hypothetical protein
MKPSLDNVNSELLLSLYAQIEFMRSRMILGKGNLRLMLLCPAFDNLLKTDDASRLIELLLENSPTKEWLGGSKNLLRYWFTQLVPSVRMAFVYPLARGNLNHNQLLDGLHNLLSVHTVGGINYSLTKNYSLKNRKEEPYTFDGSGANIAVFSRRNIPGVMSSRVHKNVQNLWRGVDFYYDDCLSTRHLLHLPGPLGEEFNHYLVWPSPSKNFPTAQLHRIG